MLLLQPLLSGETVGAEPPALRGRCNYVKIISKKYPYVIYLGNDSKGMFKLQSDCEKSRTIFLEINGTHISGKWVKMKPGSRGESIIMAACNM